MLHNFELHPVYGAVPSDGDFVQAGDVLGLSSDTQAVVTAPGEGWIRLVESSLDSARRLQVEIWPEPIPPTGTDRPT